MFRIKAKHQRWLLAASKRRCGLACDDNNVSSSRFGWMCIGQTTCDDATAGRIQWEERRMRYMCVHLIYLANASCRCCRPNIHKVVQQPTNAIFYCELIWLDCAINVCSAISCKRSWIMIAIPNTITYITIRHGECIGKFYFASWVFDTSHHILN